MSNDDHDDDIHVPSHVPLAEPVREDAREVGANPANDTEQSADQKSARFRLR